MVTGSGATDGFGRRGIDFVLTYSELFQGFVRAGLARPVFYHSATFPVWALVFCKFSYRKEKWFVVFVSGVGEIGVFLCCFSSVCLFWFFKTESLCVALAVQEFAL